MRVLFVTNYLEHLAAQPYAGIFSQRQAESLRRLGVEIEFFDLGRSFSPIRLWKKWRELRALVRASRPSVVHAQYGTVVALVSALAGGRSLITFCGSDVLPGASVSFVRTWLGIALSNLAAVLADRVICVSEEMRRALWFRRRDVDVVPHGVDTSLFAPAPRAAAREQLRWDAHAPVALFVGLRDPGNKGLALADAAVLEARDVYPDLTLYCVAKTAPADMPGYFHAADLLLFTSRQEGSPNAVKEALACNLPVVSVPVGDVEERLEGVKPSVVVPRDPKMLGDAIVAVLRDGRRSNGREIVSAISLEAIAERVLSIYREMEKQG